MGVDIAVTTETFGNEDRSWLNSRKGFDTCRSETLDVSAFVAAHLADKGAIPSGTCLAKLSASGLMVPYEPAGSGGAEIGFGLLFSTTKVGSLGSDTDLSTAANVSVAVLWEGIVDESDLPAFTGTTDGEIDADFKTDVSTVRWE